MEFSIWNYTSILPPPIILDTTHNTVNTVEVLPNINLLPIIPNMVRIYILLYNQTYHIRKQWRRQGTETLETLHPETPENLQKMGNSPRLSQQ